MATDRAFLGHYTVKPAAETNDGILAAADLGAQAKTIEEGFNKPDIPRNIKIKGNASGISGNVKIYGTNFADEAIEEEIAADGTDAKSGNLAFKTVTKATLPVEHNAEAKQKTTSAVTGITKEGEVTLTVTAAVFGIPATRDISLTLSSDDASTTTTVATAIKETLNADEIVGAHFVVTSSSANVIMEAKKAAPQDNTINLVVKSAGDTGLVIGTITKNTVTGSKDRISIGWGKKIGLPYTLPADELVILKLFDNAADAGTVTEDGEDIEKNVYSIAGTPNGTKALSLYTIM
ncbi:MAG: hypothetical protein ACOX4U_00500 [Anaerovoracaceae bacterium]